MVIRTPDLNIGEPNLTAVRLQAADLLGKTPVALHGQSPPDERRVDAPLRQAVAVVEPWLGLEPTTHCSRACSRTHQPSRSPTSPSRTSPRPGGPRWAGTGTARSAAGPVS